MIGKPTTEPAVRAEKVWRYLKFSRFVWLLQKKQLWLSRADLLGDPWEITLAGDQLQHVISHAPITTLPLPKVKPETAMERAKRIIPLWRREMFVNCWSNSDHESHALWRVYCGSPERLIGRHGFSRRLRTLDALQLAVAIELADQDLLDYFVVADQSLGQVAVDEGLKVINPEIA